MNRLEERIPLLLEQGWEDSGMGAECVGLLPRKQIDLPMFGLDAVKKDAWTELLLLLHLSWPTVLAYILEMTVPMANVFSTGHISAEALAACTLGSTIIIVTGFSIITGINTALDTLAAQSFTGSDNPFALGILLQRSTLITSVLTLPIAVLWWFAGDLLTGMGQDPVIAEMAGSYIKVIIPGLIPYCIFECVKRYLNAQGIMKAPTVVLMIVAPINILMNYLFVWVPPFQIGYLGAPLAQVITYWLLAIVILLYAFFIEGYEAWGGFSREAWKHWGHFLWLGIPGISMVCCEWWAFEIGTLSSGFLGNIPLAAQSIALTVGTFAYITPMAIGIATSNRIGNLLGSRCHNKAKMVALVVNGIATVVVVTSFALLYFMRETWPYIFTSDAEVAHEVSLIAPAVALFSLIDGYAAINAGIIRGIGKQKLGGIAVFASYYVIGLPIGLYLAFKCGFGLLGLWIGLSLSQTFTVIGEAWIILRLDWKKEVQKCFDRIEVNV